MDMIDPRELTKDQLVLALLSMQDQTLQLSQTMQELQTALEQQIAKSAELQATLAHNTGRLNNVAALLTQREELSNTLIRDYCNMMLSQGLAAGDVGELRVVLDLASALVSTHILKILVGSEGDLTHG